MLHGEDSDSLPFLLRGLLDMGDRSPQLAASMAASSVLGDILGFCSAGTAAGSPEQVRPAYSCASASLAAAEHGCLPLSQPHLAGVHAKERARSRVI